MDKKMFRNALHKKVAPMLLALLATTSLSVLPKRHTAHASVSRVSANRQLRKHNSARHAKRVLRVLINKNKSHRKNVRRHAKHQYHYKKHSIQRVHKLNARHYHNSKVKTASHVPVLRNKHMTQKQVHHQKTLGRTQIKHIRKNASDNIDNGLTKADKRARARIVFLESRGEWNASNGKCYGRFQLLPQYLGWSHGHLNMNHKHQIQVANAYVAKRYGSWTNALRFHLAYGYY